MIYTVTLNPAIDYVVEVEKFTPGTINHTNRTSVYYGGKGLNVSSVLSTLGLESVALGFIAGFTGKEIERGFCPSGCRTDFICVPESLTRINIKLVSDSESEINSPAPFINPEYLDQLLHQLEKLQPTDILVLSGSSPKSLGENVYAVIMEHAESSGAKIVVDAEGSLLLNTLARHPFMIKPNRHELEDLFSVSISDSEQVIEYAGKLQSLGAENVLVSLGGEGAILLAADGQVYRSKAMALSHPVKNTVGAGDSMVAGFIAGYLHRGDYRMALDYGVAAGTATACSDRLCSIELFTEIYESIR